MANGFLTDTTLCIGCKACEVACKQWNQLPADGFSWSGNSYDNTMALGATTWRHVAFIERFPDAVPGGPLASFVDHAPSVPPPASDLTGPGLLDGSRWLMMSDVCKHCKQAGCMQACPTGAIVRTEFDSVYVQPDICNGCGYCVPSCPFGVIQRNELDGRAFKCTLCYDRQKIGLEPACAKACPTNSIIFGDTEDLREQAHERVHVLRERGVTDAYVYGENEGSVGTLNSLFVLRGSPQTYNLPDTPKLPQDNVLPAVLSAAFAALAFSVALLRVFGKDG